MQRVSLHGSACALIAVAALGLAPASASAVNAKRGAWSGTAFSSRGAQTPVTFTVTKANVLKFKTGRKTPMYCQSYVMPGLEYPPLRWPYDVPRAKKNGTDFWGLHKDNKMEWQMVLNGKWRSASRASGKFTLTGSGGLCYARYTFSAHFAHR